MSTSKKPPPDHPGNLRGRRRQALESAWIAACGGIHIVLGEEGAKFEGYKSRKPPEDAQERFEKICKERGLDKPLVLPPVPPQEEPKPKKGRAKTRAESTAKESKTKVIKRPYPTPEVQKEILDPKATEPSEAFESFLDFAMGKDD